MKKNPPFVAISGILIKEGLTDEELDEVQRELFKKVCDSLEEICAEIPQVSFNSAHHYIELNPEESNCFRCEQCGTWATNIREPSKFPGLTYGMRFKGKLVCLDCKHGEYDPKYGWST